MLINGVDTAWPQGASGGAGGFNFTCATRGNVGLQGDSHYTERINATRADKREAGHYHFNGMQSPESQARFFVANLYDFRTGDMLGLDSEYESGTNTSAMNPTDAGRFFDVVHDLTNGYPYGGMAAYINRSIRAQWDWSPVWARGIRRWIASPNTDPGNWDIWQHSIVNGVDQNYATQTFASFVGAQPQQKVDEMLDLVGTNTSPEYGPGAYVVINWAEGTYWWVPNTTVVSYLTALSVQQPQYVMVHLNQDASILEGLVKVPAWNNANGYKPPAPVGITATVDGGSITVKAPSFTGAVQLAPVPE